MTEKMPILQMYLRRKYLGLLQAIPDGYLTFRVTPSIETNVAAWVPEDREVLAPESEPESEPEPEFESGYEPESERESEYEREYERVPVPGTRFGVRYLIMRPVIMLRAQSIIDFLLYCWSCLPSILVANNQHILAANDHQQPLI